MGHSTGAGEIIPLVNSFCNSRDDVFFKNFALSQQVGSLIRAVIPIKLDQEC